MNGLLKAIGFVTLVGLSRLAAQDVIVGPDSVKVGETAQYTAANLDGTVPFSSEKETIRGLWTAAPGYDFEKEAEYVLNGFEFVDDPDDNENTITIRFKEQGVYEIHHKLTTEMPIKQVTVYK